MQSEAAQSSGKQQSRRRGLSFEAKMMLPALVILAAISILPLIYIIWMSLNNVTLLGGSGIDPTGPGSATGDAC